MSKSRFLHRCLMDTLFFCILTVLTLVFAKSTLGQFVSDKSTSSYLHLLPRETCLLISVSDVQKLKEFCFYTAISKAVLVADPSGEQTQRTLGRLAKIFTKLDQTVFRLDEVLDSFQGRLVFALLQVEDRLAGLIMVDAKDNEIVWEHLAKAYADEVVANGGKQESLQYRSISITQAVGSSPSEEIGWFVYGETVVISTDLLTLQGVAEGIQKGVGISASLPQDELWQLASQGMRSGQESYADIYFRPDILLDRLPQSSTDLFLSDRNLREFLRRHVKAIRLQAITTSPDRDLEFAIKIVSNDTYVQNRFLGSNGREAMSQMERLAKQAPGKSTAFTSLHCHVGEFLDSKVDMLHSTDADDRTPKHIRRMPTAYNRRLDALENHFCIFETEQDGFEGYFPIRVLDRLEYQLDEVLLPKAELMPDSALLAFQKSLNIEMPPENEVRHGVNGKYYVLNRFPWANGGGLGVIRDQAYFSSRADDLAVEHKNARRMPLVESDYYNRVRNSMSKTLRDEDNVVAIRIVDLGLFFKKQAEAGDKTRPVVIGAVTGIKDWQSIYQALSDSLGPLGCLVRRTNDGFHLGLFTMKRE
ncbi:hypothetical protein SH449x_003144 [Pirellulaceae bacterium SH449]